MDSEDMWIAVSNKKKRSNKPFDYFVYPKWIDCEKADIKHVFRAMYFLNKKSTIAEIVEQTNKKSTFGHVSWVLHSNLFKKNVVKYSDENKPGCHLWSISEADFNNTYKEVHPVQQQNKQNK